MADAVLADRSTLDTHLVAGRLSWTSERQASLHSICLFGELDLATAPAVHDELTRVEADDADAIMLDLSNLTFMDSTGVRLLIQANTRSRTSDGRLTLLRGPAAVQRVMELSGVDVLLPFAD